MPQIWATYEEIADCFGTTVAAARKAMIERNLPRRFCSDGQARVKLPMSMAVELIRSTPEFGGTNAAAGDRFDKVGAELAAIRENQGAVQIATAIDTAIQRAA